MSVCLCVYRRISLTAEPKEPKARTNKTGFNFTILFKYSWEIVCSTILYMIFQYGYKAVQIQWILIGLEPIMKIHLKPIGIFNHCFFCFCTTKRNLKNNCGLYMQGY